MKVKVGESLFCWDGAYLSGKVIEKRKDKVLIDTTDGIEEVLISELDQHFYKETNY